MSDKRRIDVADFALVIILTAAIWFVVGVVVRWNLHP